VSTIQREAWIAAMATLDPPMDQDAFTIAELMVIFDRKETVMKERVRKLLQTGAATLTRKRITDSLGRSQTVPAYRLVTKGGSDGTQRSRSRRRRDA
jgi:hypothetical protein